MERSLSNDLREALKNLSVSQKRVKAVADLALMNSRDYKEIVHEIEKHISRTSAEKRLAGIYVVDAIIRGFEKMKADDGNVFAARFAVRMPQTIAYCREGSQQKELKKVLDNWVARGLFKDEDLMPESDKESAKDSPRASPAPRPNTGGSTGAPNKVASIMSLLQQKANAAAGPSADVSAASPTSAKSEAPRSQPGPAPPVLSGAPSSRSTTYGATPYPGSGPSSVPAHPSAGGASNSAGANGQYGPMTGQAGASGQRAMYGNGGSAPPNGGPNAAWVPPNSTAQQQGWNGNSTFTYGSSSSSSSSSSQPPPPPPPHMLNAMNANSSKFDFTFGSNGEKHPLTKTKMCKRILESGSCRFGASCGFAHTRDELRQRGNSGESRAGSFSGSSWGEPSKYGPPGPNSANPGQIAPFRNNLGAVMPNGPAASLLNQTPSYGQPPPPPPPGGASVINNNMRLPQGGPPGQYSSQPHGSGAILQPFVNPLGVGVFSGQPPPPPPPQAQAQLYGGGGGFREGAASQGREWNPAESSAAKRFKAAE